jgi:hypothetical protein
VRMDNNTIGICVSVAAFALFVSFQRWFNKRLRSIFPRWADANGFQILSTRQHYFFTGPFRFWTNRRNQIIYSFRVRDQEGRERSGWARCGSPLLNDQIEIRWNEPEFIA